MRDNEATGAKIWEIALWFYVFAGVCSLQFSAEILRSSNRDNVGAQFICRPAVVISKVVGETGVTEPQAHL
jgi:hypothetical protein